MFTIFRFFRMTYLNRSIHDITHLLDGYRQGLWVIMGTSKAFITLDSQKQKRTVYEIRGSEIRGHLN